MMKDLLTIAKLTAADVKAIIDRTTSLKQMQQQGITHQPLANRSLGMIFEKSSTRTRVSFEVGMYQLGGQALFLSSADLQLGRGEPVADTARVLSRYLDAIMIRTFAQEMVEELAQHATIPVINGLTDLHHPCQALADLFTVQEKKGKLKGLKLAYIGDGNNVANSLLEACVKTSMHFSIACPPGYELNAAILADAQSAARETGSCIETTVDPYLAVMKADVLYTDVWASMGQEAEHAKRVKAFQGYQIDRKLLQAALPDAMVMHCLPAHRGEEIAADVIDGPQSVVFDEAENRLHTQKAVLEMLIGKQAAEENEH
jgi:ornithine carbamoyltransferase